VQFLGEVGGIVPPVKDWSDSSIGNIPMGQGIAVTALQMASAFATVANSGIQVKPRLVKQVGEDNFHTTAADKHRVIPAKVAKQIRSYLTTAVDDGTGEEAQIAGYEVAGKTGTAECALPNGAGYAKNTYTSSFIGMAPADHPRLVVLCSVGWTSQFGGVAAAPPFKEIMQFALQHLEIAP
jgi:cell division protein FtsI (penicillin-binding protein 3)